jgi:probable F420-dependent oxidoreductase
LRRPQRLAETAIGMTMQFTLNLPMAAGRFRAIPPSQYLDVARAGEAAGFDHISVPDNVIYPESISAPYPYSEDGRRIWDADTPSMDPWVVIPAMAAVTSRIRFFTNVLKLAIREPILVAKTLSSAACLSGGRVGLGVGLSWMPEEFRYLHQDMQSRGARVDEAIEVIRALLAGGMVEYHGRYYDFDRLQISPTPPAQVPIYVGGTTPAALRRAARLGDGWLSMIHEPDELRELIGQLFAERETAGRPRAGFEVKVLWPGPLDLDQVRELEDLGATDVLVTPWLAEGETGDAFEHKRDSLLRFAERVIRPTRSGQSPKPPATASC